MEMRMRGGGGAAGELLLSDALRNVWDEAALSTRITIGLSERLHLYFEARDRRIHLGVGKSNYPRFAPPVLPRWLSMIWLDRWSRR